MSSRILYCGDPHGHWTQIYRAAERCRPAAVVLLGDFDLDRPLDAVMEPVTAAGTQVYWIAGNHEGDTDPWHDNVFRATLADRDLNGRVVDFGAPGAPYRVAGLGGIFRYKIWNPYREPVWRRRADFLRSLPPDEHWRDGLPRRHRVSIWYEDYARLMKRRAEVLVCHEAPTTMRRQGRPLGRPVIDRLAEAMGVGAIFHGHHHSHYTACLPSGIVVHGVGLGAVVDEHGTTIEPPIRAVKRQAL